MIAAALDAFVSGIDQAQANGIKLQAHIDAATLVTAQFTRLRDELNTINMDSPLSITKSALDLELRRSRLSLVGYVADTELLGSDHIDEIALDAAMVRSIGVLALGPAHSVTTFQNAAPVRQSPSTQADRADYRREAARTHADLRKSIEVYQSDTP